MSRYQARQDVVIDKKPYEKYLSKHYGDLSKVTKKQIFQMLTNLGKEDQVKHIHLIHYEITGVPPNNIGYLEVSLMRDFEVLMRLFDDKKGVVSVRQVLYRLLLKNGVVCCKEEFGIRREDEKLCEFFAQLNALAPAGAQAFNGPPPTGYGNIQPGRREKKNLRGGSPKISVGPRLGGAAVRPPSECSPKGPPSSTRNYDRDRS